MHVIYVVNRVVHFKQDMEIPSTSAIAGTVKAGTMATTGEAMLESDVYVSCYSLDAGEVAMF